MNDHSDRRGSNPKLLRYRSIEELEEECRFLSGRITSGILPVPADDLRRRFLA
jgi:hypothetical protein